MDRSGGGRKAAPDHAQVLGTARVQKAETAADKIAALRAKVAATIGASKAKGGLGISLHPALEDLGQWKSNRSADDKSAASGSRPHSDGSNAFRKPQSSPFPHREPGKNPYLEDDSVNNGPSGRSRPSRDLQFNSKGKYIAQANALRKQAALDQMKQRIAEQTRKSGIEEYGSTNFFEEPPEIEWWDAAVIESYDSSDVKPGSITQFIQHPVQLEPPQDQHNPEPKAMYLTTKEQAKLRRQRRGAALKELQAKIRLGLEPAPPPKVKKKNLMRVLGTQAVENPTAVEQMVEKQIQDRHQKHVDMNHERQLSKEQKHEKLASQQEKDAALGLHILVFKIKHLVNGKNRFKIAHNAEQLALTGMCLLNPEFNLVIVEGGSHSINKYRKLMLNRINWTENAESLKEEKKHGSKREWLAPEDDKGVLKDISTNSCRLVFEGEIKNRHFKKWGSRVAETTQEARDVLARFGVENFWAQAKSIA